MICIFSTSADHSTTDVIRWLHYLGKKDVIRINYNDRNSSNYTLIDIDEGTFCFKVDNQLIPLKEIEAVWYRKGKNWLCDQFYQVSVEDHSRFSVYLNAKIESEESTLSTYVHHIIENSISSVGSASKNNLNKLLVLCAAKEIGLLTPHFYITNNKRVINQIFDKSKNLITKPISDGLYLFENIKNNTGYFSYTEKLNKDMLENLPNQIFPSFFQHNIDKKFEIRVFFLEDKCYSMAIFSQSDEQTKVDFRKYNEEKPNRYVPFTLPEEIDQKLIRLFKKLDLNTGSVDLLVDQQENFYFLEINPVGQFGMVSSPCNYFLEKKVALKLIEYALQNRTN